MKPPESNSRTLSNFKRDSPDFSIESTGDAGRAILVDAVFAFGTDRPEVADAFVDLIALIEAAEGDAIAYGATPVLRALLAVATPATYDESLQFNYNFVTRASGPAQAYVDLMPGMRVRLAAQTSQLLPNAPPNLTNGYVSTGDTFFDVIGTPGANGTQVLGFDNFLATLPIPNVTDAPGGAGGLIDLRSETFRRRHLRLCYPASFPTGNSAGSRGLMEAAALIGVDTLSDLAQATTTFYSGRTPAGTISTAFFRGRTVLIPEILAFQNNQPGYYALGTTCRNFIARYALMPRLNGMVIQQFSSNYSRYLPSLANIGGMNSQTAWMPVYPRKPTAISTRPGISTISRCLRAIPSTPSMSDPGSISPFRLSRGNGGLYFALNKPGAIPNTRIAYLPPEDATGLAASLTLQEAWEAGGVFAVLGSSVNSAPQFAPVLRRWLDIPAFSQTRMMWLENPNDAMSLWVTKAIPIASDAVTGRTTTGFRNYGLTFGPGCSVSVDAADASLVISPGTGAATITLLSADGQLDLPVVSGPARIAFASDAGWGSFLLAQLALIMRGVLQAGCLLLRQVSRAAFGGSEGRQGGTTEGSCPGIWSRCPDGGAERSLTAHADCSRFECAIHHGHVLRRSGRDFHG